MTREEREQAIAILENEKKCVNRANKNDYCNRDCYNCELVKTDTEILTALDMAIKALEQEPQTGRWILADEQNKEDVENDNYRFICSECQCSDIHAKGTIVPYCWKCGAKMVEPQERSEE